jgi:hypothetical protein
VYQQSIYQQRIPDDWRLSKVIPLYKGKGDKSSPSSYRPISLTAIACKVLERIVVDQLRTYLTDNSLISAAQHGFVPSRSTATNLLQCDLSIAQHLNQGDTCDLILLDYSKAFDSVQHNILLSKLSSFGIHGPLSAWLADFLKDRSQFVFYSGASSNVIPVTSGVIQGSVVGPLLFTLLINDLPLCISHSDIYMYADDVKLVNRSTSQHDCLCLQADLDAICKWSDTNGLQFNLQKNQCLHIGRGNHGHVYTLCGSPITVVESCSDLGLLRTRDFSYTAHVNSTIAKASRAAGMLHKVFATRSMDLQVKLYTTYVRPIVEYLTVIWNPESVSLSDSVERVQRRFTKRIHGLRWLPYEERLSLN